MNDRSTLILEAAFDFIVALQAQVSPTWQAELPGRADQ
jgi:hypothetical protein